MKLKMIPLLFNITAKINVEKVISELKSLDIFSEGQNEITDSQKVEVGLTIVSAILPQLDKISNDIIPLVCAYKNVSKEEAEELDIVEILKEFFGNEAVTSFLSKALRKKVEQLS